MIRQIVILVNSLSLLKLQQPSGALNAFSAILQSVIKSDAGVINFPNDFKLFTGDLHLLQLIAAKHSGQLNFLFSFGFTKPAI